MKGKPLDLAKLEADLEAAAAECADYRHQWTREEEQLLSRFYNRIPASVLAKKMGISLASVRNKAGVLGLMRPSRGK